jgi:FAD/FMN-containing dehydrogenase
MSVQSATTVQPAIDRLREGIRGRVITPDDPDYDVQRGIFLGGTDPHPAVIVRVADAADVASAIAVACDTGLPLAVRSGGHSGAGHGSADDGLVIDLRDMKALDIDAEARTAWADAGLTAVEVAVATAEHGLGIGFGDTGSVGISGSP